MKMLAGFLLLSTSIFAQTNSAPIAGRWEGTATVKGQQVPISLELSGSGSVLKAALVNGLETSPASQATLNGDHLTLTFNYFARTLDATVTGDTLLAEPAPTQSAVR